MALVGKRDGAILAMAGNSAMPGRKHCEICLAAGITARSKRTVIDGRHLYVGATQRMGRG
ncbi:hypothetical protein PS723_05562 [Pseudomonas fluorescens]|uniref:Uncharacterized protein n=1 Tax=Pseudomonas fluorescens TaxID=294 RepID=A0A5E7FLW8_PSEFL|nr:hypothetical protein PS723_05562 [Pseudomonas fluorescens]